MGSHIQQGWLQRGQNCEEFHEIRPVTFTVSVCISACKQLENPWEDFHEVSEGVRIRFTDTFSMYLNYNTHTHTKTWHLKTWSCMCLCAHRNVTHTKYSLARKICSRKIVSYVERNTLSHLVRFSLRLVGLERLRLNRRYFDAMLHRNCESFDWFCRNTWVYLSRIKNLLTS